MCVCLYVCACACVCILFVQRVGHPHWDNFSVLCKVNGNFAYFQAVELFILFLPFTVRVKMITGSLVTLGSLFAPNYRYRCRLGARTNSFNYHYLYRLGIRSHPFISIGSQLPS